MGLKWEGLMGARAGGKDGSAPKFDEALSFAADDGLLVGAKPIDVAGLRSFNAEEGREADILWLT